MTIAKRIVMAWLQGSAGLLLGFPFLLGLYAVIDSPLAFPIWLAALSFFCTFGYIIVGAIRTAKRWPSLLAACALPLLCAWLVPRGILAYPYTYAHATVNPDAAYAGLWLLASLLGRQIRLSLLAGGPSFGAGVWWLGMVGYFLASIFYPFISRTTAAYASWVNILGFITLAITLYQTNRSTLDKESVDTKEEQTDVDKETKFRNRTFISALFALIAGIAAIPIIARVAKQAAVYLFGLLLWLLETVAPTNTGRPKRPKSDMSDLIEDKEPSAFALFMEKLLLGVAIVLLLAMALLILYVLGKYAIRWLKRFLGWYGERLEKAPKTGYVDEKEVLMESREWANELFGGLKRRLTGWLHKEPGWDELADNRERIRHAYRSLLLGKIARGYEHDEALTPRETSRKLNRREPLGPDEAAAFRLYEDVRYGSRDVPDEQAAEVKPLFRTGGQSRE